MSMGPEYGTEKYKNQVETIKKFLNSVKDMGEHVVQETLVMFMIDTSYSRAAICQAEKEFKKEQLQQTNS